jgi:hypothetical protein
MGEKVNIKKVKIVEEVEIWMGDLVISMQETLQE